MTAKTGVPLYFFSNGWIFKYLVHVFRYSFRLLRSNATPRTHAKVALILLALRVRVRKTGQLFYAPCALS